MCTNHQTSTYRKSVYIYKRMESKTRKISVCVNVRTGVCTLTNLKYTQRIGAPGVVNYGTENDGYADNCVSQGDIAK